MNASATTVPADLILVGHVTGAFGIQGWVKIHPYSADGGAMLHAKTWWLAQARGVAAAGKSEPDLATLTDVEKLEAKVHGEAVVARIMGMATREAAEGLRGRLVLIPRSHFPILAANEYYWTDLIGMAVTNLAGESLGVVDNLIDNGAHPILRVVLAQDTAQREFLIPFVERFVPGVDLKGRQITVDWGLDY